MPRFGRALVVEDYRLARDLMIQVLERAGFEAVGVATGTEAIRRASDGGHDVILLDIMLPDMNGLDVAAELRRRPATALTPIVAVTAEAADEMRSCALAVGFDAYLVKPIDVRTFARDICEAMQNPRSRCGCALQQRGVESPAA